MKRYRVEIKETIVRTGFFELEVPDDYDAGDAHDLAMETDGNSDPGTTWSEEDCTYFGVEGVSLLEPASYDMYPCLKWEE